MAVADANETFERPRYSGGQLLKLAERRRSHLRVAAVGKPRQPKQLFPGHMSMQATDIPANVTPMMQQYLRLN